MKYLSLISETVGLYAFLLTPIEVSAADRQNRSANARLHDQLHDIPWIDWDSVFPLENLVPMYTPLQEAVPVTPPEKYKTMVVTPGGTIIRVDGLGKDKPETDPASQAVKPFTHRGTGRAGGRTIFKA